MEPTPYLQLRDRLSQVWLNKNTIILVLMAIKLTIFSFSLQSSLETSKYYTLNSCPSIDSVASSAVSIPHYLSKSANHMIQKSVQEINEKTVDTLDLILNGAEQLIIFSLEMVIGTYTCVLVAAIDGAVDVAVNSTETIISYVNGTLLEITDELQDGLDDLSDIVNKVIDAAETVADLFTDDEDDDTTDSFSKVNLTMSSLKDFTIPGSINDKLEALKENTPDFDTVKNKTEELIKTPFDYVKKQLANTTIFSSDSNDLYVPSLQNVQVCSNNSDKIKDFYSNLAFIVHKIMIILVIILVVAAVCVILPVILTEIRRWRRLRNLRYELSSQSQQINKLDPITVYEETFNRYPSKAGAFVSRASSQQETKSAIRWFMAYILSPRASIVLGLSIAGLIVIVCQFIMLSVLDRAISNQDTPFDDIATDLSKTIEFSVSNWTQSTNEYLEQKEEDVNDELLSWVKTTTDSVNDTISAFVDEMNDVLAEAFNGTILYDPVKAIVGCVIESKLIKIEEGLTWVHDNAEITFPRVTDEYLSLAFDDSSSNSTNATTASNSTNGTVTNYSEFSLMSKTNTLMSDAESLMLSVLQMIIEQYRKALMIEVWIAVALFVIWLIQIVVGFLMIWLKLKSPEEDNNYDKTTGIGPDVKVEMTNISDPRPLTKNEQRKYGFPYSDPFKTPLASANQCDYTDPFSDEGRIVTPQMATEREASSNAETCRDKAPSTLSYP